MINVFIGALIIQMLFGFAFKSYIWVNYRHAKIVYSSMFNSIFALLVVCLIGLYAYALKNHKKKVDKFQKALTDHLKYVLVLNIIALLLAQICLLYTNQFYLFLNPVNPVTQIHKLENQIHTLELKLEPQDIEKRIKKLEHNLERLKKIN